MVVLSRVLLPLWVAFVFVAGLAWWWPNRPVTISAPPITGKLASLSFAPFRDGQSPVRDIFPKAADVEADAALVATRARGIRTYAAIEGDYDLPAIARRHGLTLWQGIWLGGDRAQNARELARGIAIANANPDVVTRLVVGNEVMLRRDLPVGELIAAIETVRAATRVPVTYADVWEFWREFPQIAAHVDVVTVHMLPYWEDEPLPVARAIPHIAETYHDMQALFPGKPIAIGEAGWPSRGRARRGAVPSRIDEALFLRRFVAFAEAEHVDYNLIEAFDQTWKAGGEGTVGANWGLWTPRRAEKFALDAPVSRDPHWRRHAALTVLAGSLLLAGTFAMSRQLPSRAQARLAISAMPLGGALAFAWTCTGPDINVRFEAVAALANMAAQGLLAGLMMVRVAQRLSDRPRPPARTGRQTLHGVRRLLRGQAPGVVRHNLLEDLMFVFAWTAALMQVLLVVDPRYRDFPIGSFAVPAMAVAIRAVLGDLPRGGGGPAEAAIVAVLGGGALIGAWVEGADNPQSREWTAMALLLTIPFACRLIRPGQARSVASSSQAQAASAAPVAPNVAS